MDTAAPGPGGPADGAGGMPPPLPNGLLAPPLLFAGPTLLGALFAYLLYGVFITQVAQYSQTVPRSEALWLKILVALVMVIQTIQLGFITDTAWTTCVLAFLDPINMVVPPPSAPGTGVLNGLVAWCVQMFFAWKVFTLGGKKPIIIAVAALIAILGTTQLGAAIGVTITFIKIASSQNLFALKIPITVGLTTTMTCDILITVSMIVILAKYKDKTSFARTKSLLNVLILTTIENGLITTVTAITNLVVYFTRTQDMINIAVNYVIGGMYAIVLITTLNRRQTGTRPDGTSISLSDANGFVSSRNNGATNIATARGPAPSYQVNVLSSMSGDSKAPQVGDDLRRLEGGLGHHKPDIMVSVSKEVHADHPYAMSHMGEKH